MTTEKYGFVYIWYDKGRQRFYVGSHWGNEDDGYICSNDAMREARKDRPQDFKRRILTKITTNRSDLLAEEQRWLDMIKPGEFGFRFYNINSKVGQYAWWMNEKTKQQVGKKLSEANKRLVAEGKHHWLGNTELAKYGQSCKKNFAHTKESKQKMSKSQKLAFQEGRQKSWNKGRTDLPPSWNKGRPWSVESKKKMSKARLGKEPWNKGIKMMWITNGQITKQVLKGPIPKGFNRGRKLNAPSGAFFI